MPNTEENSIFIDIFAKAIINYVMHTPENINGYILYELLMDFHENIPNQYTLDYIYKNYPDLVPEG